MSDWHFYSLETGLFIGRSVSCPDGDVAGNTPVGCGAAAEVASWRLQRVDLATGLLQRYQPPPPPADDLTEWVWSDGREQWLPNPTLQALKKRRTADVLAAIEALEMTQARPVRELLQAMLAGETLGRPARDRLAEIASGIASLRAVQSAIEAAQTPEDLALVKLP